jgi:hypothetical protein
MRAVLDFDYQAFQPDTADRAALARFLNVVEFLREGQAKSICAKDVAEFAA